MPDNTKFGCVNPPGEASLPGVCTLRPIMLSSITMSVLNMSVLAMSASSAVAVEPASVQAGMFEFVPTLGLEQRYDTNIFSRADHELESWVTVLSPSLKTGVDIGSLRMDLDLMHISGVYDSSSNDNFEDNRLGFLSEWELNHRNQLDLQYLYEDGHEDRGTGYSQGDAAELIDEPNTYTDQTAMLSYTLGSEQSSGRLVLNLKNYRREYSEESALTRDREENGGGGTFFWRVGGRTELLFEANTTEISYDNETESIFPGEPALDSTAMSFLLGIAWDGSGKTQGQVKLGHAEKDFDDEGREDFSGFSWDVGVSWHPREYSRFSLNTARDEREVDSSSGSYIDYKVVDVSWEQGWTDRLQSKLFVVLSDESYEGDVEGRVDEVSTYGLRIDYAVRRWLELGLSMKDIQRDSNVQQYEFDRQQVALHFMVSL